MRRNEYNARSIGQTLGIESASSRRRRHINQVHTMVKNAVGEGIPTAAASFAVVPGVVRLREPELEPGEQITLSHQLLPAAGELSRNLARNSKQGDKRLLLGVSRLAQTGLVDYARLSYSPEAFDITTEDQNRPVLYVADPHLEPEDLEVRFRGCPALLYGSISKINRLLASTILEHQLYEQAIDSYEGRLAV